MVPCLPRHTVAAVVAIRLQPAEYLHHVVCTGHLEGCVPHILPVDRKRAPLVGIGRLNSDADAVVPEGGWVERGRQVIHVRLIGRCRGWRGGGRLYM